MVGDHWLSRLLEKVTRDQAGELYMESSQAQIVISALEAMENIIKSQGEKLLDANIELDMLRAEIARLRALRGPDDPIDGE